MFKNQNSTLLTPHLTWELIRGLHAPQSHRTELRPTEQSKARLNTNQSSRNYAIVALFFSTNSECTLCRWDRTFNILKFVFPTMTSTYLNKPILRTDTKQFKEIMGKKLFLNLQLIVLPFDKSYVFEILCLIVNKLIQIGRKAITQVIKRRFIIRKIRL